MTKRYYIADLLVDATGYSYFETDEDLDEEALKEKALEEFSGSDEDIETGDALKCLDIQEHTKEEYEKFKNRR